MPQILDIELEEYLRCCPNGINFLLQEDGDTILTEDNNLIIT